MATKPITPTSGGSITVPSSGTVYTLKTDANVYRSNTKMVNTSGTEVLAFSTPPDLIHRRLASNHTWSSWNGTSWTTATTTVPPVLPAQPTITLSAPTKTTMVVTVSDVVNIDGYRYQWRTHPSSVSPNGTRITPGSGSITDNLGNVFTLVVSTSSPPAMATMNGTAMPDGGNTAVMEWYNNLIYGQDNPTKFWYTYNLTTRSWTRVQTAPPVITPTPTPTPTWTTV